MQRRAAGARGAAAAALGPGVGKAVHGLGVAAAAAGDTGQSGTSADAAALQGGDVVPRTRHAVEIEPLSDDPIVVETRPDCRSSSVITIPACIPTAVYTSPTGNPPITTSSFLIAVSPAPSLYPAGSKTANTKRASDFPGLMGTYRHLHRPDKQRVSTSKRVPGRLQCSVHSTIPTDRSKKSDCRRTCPAFGYG